MLLGALVNAATFATFTFLAPIVTGTAGLGELWVSVVLVLFGVGSFLGVTVAGRLSDRRPGLVIAAGGPLLLLGWVALAALAAQPVALLLLVFVQGTLSFALGSTLITRVLYAAAGAPTMGGSYATAALNIGAAGGPVLAATTLGPVPATSARCGSAASWSRPRCSSPCRCCGSSRHRPPGAPARDRLARTTPEGTERRRARRAARAVVGRRPPGFPPPRTATTDRLLLRHGPRARCRGRSSALVRSRRDGKAAAATAETSGAIEELALGDSLI